MKYDVNIDLANSAKKDMAEYLRGSDKILSNLNSFACLYDIVRLKDFEHPVLVLKTEEPGSKQLIAMQYDRIEGVCYDMINHLINDCIATGAIPLAVQDAIICGRMDKSIVNRIVKAIAAACAENGCVLTGGETSEQPKVIDDGTYILTSSIVGIVEKRDIIDGSEIARGDVVLGVASNGVHTNGYTLIRSIMAQTPGILEETVDGKSFIDAVLVPHMCYYNAVKDLFGKQVLKGLAHITGGGIKENLNRVLPSGDSGAPGVDAVIDLGAYNIPAVFKILKKYGRLEDKEMLRTFNMGVGLAAVVSSENAAAVIGHINKSGIEAGIIGKIVKGSGQVECRGEFVWRDGG